MRQTYDETEALKNRIVAASCEVFTEKGYAATKMSDIAERANVSRGPLYYHFQNKQVLFEYVCNQMNLSMLDEIKELFSRTDLSLSEKIYQDLIISNKYVGLVYAQEMAFQTNESDFENLKRSFIANFEAICTFKRTELDQAYRDGLLKTPEAGEQIVQIIIASYGMLIHRGTSSIERGNQQMDVESLAMFITDGIQSKFFIPQEPQKKGDRQARNQ